MVWSSVLMAGASSDTTTLSCAAETLSTASALTVSLPFKTTSVTVTVALGMTAPVESVTVPRMVPRSVPWPNTTPAAQNRKANKKTQVDAALYIKEPPPQSSLGETMYHNRKANATTNKK